MIKNLVHLAVADGVVTEASIQPRMSLPLQLGEKVPQLGYAGQLSSKDFIKLLIDVHRLQLQPWFNIPMVLAALWYSKVVMGIIMDKSTMEFDAVLNKNSLF